MRFNGRSRGFTLIELLAVTAVIVIISSVVLVNNARFGGAVLLENLAYDIALSIRQAQVYGISTRRSSGGGFVGYGLRFDMASPASYVLYADENGDGLYGSGESLQSTIIERGFRITDLCTKLPSDTNETCGAAKLDILFKRPEPDAWITRDAGIPSCTAGGTCMEIGIIKLLSPRGDSASVKVHVNGQVSVQR